ISSPYNPVHLTHVGYNQETGEFIGLPKEWQVMLQNSGITEQEQKDHPQVGHQQQCLCLVLMHWR
ncbi:P21-Rho-binding domain-containing protein, partial [Syncephalis pseudoplumigaleata]